MIDSLASGLETVAKHLPLLLLPLLLDVVIWLGPRVSFQPLLAWLGDFVAGDSSPLSLLIVMFVVYLGFPLFSNQEVWQPVLLPLAQNEPGNFEGVSEAIRGVAQSAPEQYLGVSVMPSMVAGRNAELLPFGYSPPIWQIQSPIEALLFRLLLFLAGLILLTVYLAFIAQRVKEGNSSLGWVVRRVPAILLQGIVVLILLMALAMAVMFILGVVLSAIVVLGSMLGGDGAAAFLSAMVVATVVLIGTWSALLMAFTVHGMFMNDRGVFAAMWDSLRVVQWNASSTFSLFLVIFIVTTAVNYVRGWLDPGSWWMPVGIVANAFISTGLLAATFVFFKDRYRYWRELREQLLAELERRRVQQNKA